MSCRCTRKNQRGGAQGAPLSYVNPSYQEPSSSSSQVNRLGSEPMLARPVLNATGGRRSRRIQKNKRKGGFYPSVMGSLINNGTKILPAAGVQAYRMLRNYKSKSRKNRK
jgi:hypothetical protein